MFVWLVFIFKMSDTSREEQVSFSGEGSGERPSLPNKKGVVGKQDIVQALS